MMLQLHEMQQGMCGKPEPPGEISLSAIAINTLQTPRSELRLHFVRNLLQLPQA